MTSKVASNRKKIIVVRVITQQGTTVLWRFTARSEVLIIGEAADYITQPEDHQPDSDDVCVCYIFFSTYIYTCIQLGNPAGSTTKFKY